jgi:hypothetical protein
MRNITLLCVCLTLTAVSTVIYAGVGPDLIMYLPLDEGRGDTVKDLSENGFEGKIIRDFKWIDGKRGSGLELTRDAEVQVPDHELLDGMKALTLEIWVKQETHQATGVVQKGTNWPNMSYLLQPWSDQKIYFGIQNTSSRAIAPPGSYPLGKWYHLAATFDGEMLRLYVNGEEKSKAKAPVNQVPDTATPLQVGNRLAGAIDEFVMYSRALSPDEIRRDMEGISLALKAKGSLAVTWGWVKGNMSDNIIKGGN